MLVLMISLLCFLDTLSGGINPFSLNVTAIATLLGVSDKSVSNGLDIFCGHLNHFTTTGTFVPLVGPNAHRVLQYC